MQDPNIVTLGVLPLSLAFIMFSLGLVLVPDDFKQVVTRPKGFIVGLVCQMVLLPALAAVLVWFWPMDPALAVGIMLVAACPGGMTSNLLTHLAKGDTALSISLTAVISVLSVITLPLIVGASLVWLTDAETAPGISIGRDVLWVVLIIAVPVAVGMAVRANWSEWANRFEPKSRIIATVLFGIVVMGEVAHQRSHIADYFMQAGAATLTLNLVAMVFAFMVARGFRLGRSQRSAITLETGLQNAPLAMLIAAAVLKTPAMAVPAAIYGLLMFVTAILYTLLSYRRAAVDTDEHDRPWILTWRRIFRWS